ncbi:uncharacterized protein LOC117106479 [Anneissia japonica]|uniref:uncharacterized protein LOC117106479 n=1 Tax=Anneissia japonica TaxID=1529436 RepID=UPI0014259169|nr:uncharacterized protein LOC117106479 [Anneissia japonica]
MMSTLAIRFISMCLVLTAATSLPTLPAVDYIGIGYNVLDGNPDGDGSTTGCVDPGLLTLKRVFAYTYDEGKVSSDLKYIVPDQIVYTPRSSCARTLEQNMFWGTKSYQQKLKSDTTWSVSAADKFLGYEFSKSNSYEEMYASINAYKYVYYEDRTVCNLGRARYANELYVYDKYSLSKDFIQAACKLPVNYDSKIFMQFLDTWGTHVILQAELGTKSIDRYEETQEAFVYFVLDEDSGKIVSGGSYEGFDSSVSVDMEEFEKDLTPDTSFGQYEITISSDNESPIAIEAIGMDEMFVHEYWQLFNDYVADGLCSSDWLNNLVTFRSNMGTAMSGYANWRGAAISEDPVVKIPITWPKGAYGLPQPKSGCPLTPQFNWYIGVRKHDTENGNSWSADNHFAGPYWQNDMYDNFCIKTDQVVTEYDWNWPPGEYCIYQRDTACPSGFKTGYIFWDDKNSDGNTHAGYLPKGTYNENTKIYFCCRDDGFATNPIYLPTESPFYLFPQSHRCQEVNGMKHQTEYFQFDDENTSNDNQKWGSYPYTGGDYKNHLLYYCYYTPT